MSLIRNQRDRIRIFFGCVFVIAGMSVFILTVTNTDNISNIIGFSQGAFVGVILTIIGAGIPILLEGWADRNAK